MGRLGCSSLMEVYAYGLSASHLHNKTESAGQRKTRTHGGRARICLVYVRELIMDGSVAPPNELKCIRVRDCERLISRRSTKQCQYDGHTDYPRNSTFTLATPLKCVPRHSLRGLGLRLDILCSSVFILSPFLYLRPR